MQGIEFGTLHELRAVLRHKKRAHLVPVRAPEEILDRATTLRHVSGRIWAAMEAASFLREIRAPYVTGERLLLREPWSLRHGMVLYQADEDRGDVAWAPGRLMPQNVARYAIDVETLSAIRLSELDGATVVESGAFTPPKEAPPWPSCGPLPKTEVVDLDYLRGRFRRAWDEVHGEGSFAQTSWVWRIGLSVRPLFQEKKVSP